MIPAIIKYRRVIIFGIVILAFAGFWFHGYFTGKEQKRLQINDETAKVEKEVKSNVERTKLKEQSLDDVQLNTGLCVLGIVRENRGC